MRGLWRRPAGLAIVGVAAAGIAAAVLWSSVERVRSGWGGYMAELLACQTTVDELSWRLYAVRYPELTFVDGSEWQQGTPAEELRIGGKLAMLGTAEPVAEYDYVCVFRRGQLTAADMS